jgi:hypothetical protein
LGGTSNTGCIDLITLCDQCDLCHTCPITVRKMTLSPNVQQAAAEGAAGGRGSVGMFGRQKADREREAKPTPVLDPHVEGDTMLRYIGLRLCSVSAME